ncbi:MAG: O-antigen ligase family protein [Ilumatobacteraceae bacterium]
MQNIAAWSGALVIGTVVAVSPGGLSPYGPARWMVVSTISLVLVGLALRYGTVALHTASRRAWWALLAWLAVATFLGGDVPTALLGQGDRHLGLITWLLLFGTFAAGQQVVGGDIRLLTRCTVVATACMGAWAAIEVVAGDGGRLGGPFGSAAYLGAAACLLTPVSVGVAWADTEVPPWRWAAGLASVGGVLALVGSGARAAWVGAAAAAVVVVLVRRRPHPSTLRWAVLVGAVMLVVALPWAGSLLDRPHGQTSRLDEWRIAARVVARHPLVGVGPEGYRIAVSEGIDAHYERTYGRDRVLPDRAHSGPLDVALVGGIPAAVLYVGLVGFVVLRAWRAMRESAVVAGVAMAVIGYAVQQLLLFPLAELDPVWWLFAGLVVTQTSPLRRARPVPARRAVGVAVMGLAAVALVAGIADTAADRLALHALDARADGRTDDAVAAAERAVRLRPDLVRYRIVASSVLAARGSLADIDEALGEVDAALAWSPLDPMAVDERGSLLIARAGITGDAADAAAAVEYGTVLVGRDPLRARWQVQLGRAAAIAGDTETARAAWTTAADLSPDDAAVRQLLADLEATDG